MTTPAETVAKIEDLLKKATPGPWKMEGNYDAPHGLEYEISGRGVWTARCQNKHDFELIALLRNSIESILNERKQHVEALERIVELNEHTQSCRLSCGCGIKIVKKALAEGE